MQKFRFQYQFKRKGLENNSGLSVKQSEKPKWPPKSKMAANFQLLVALPLIIFVLLNINRDLGLYGCMYK